MHTSIRSTRPPTPPPGGSARRVHRRPLAAIEPREVTAFQREQLYKWANATGWPASRFNAWLQDRFSVDHLDQIRTWVLACEVIDTLRAVVSDQAAPRPAAPPAAGSPAGQAADRPQRARPASAFFARSAPSPCPRVSTDPRPLPGPDLSGRSPAMPDEARKKSYPQKQRMVETGVKMGNPSRIDARM